MSKELTPEEQIAHANRLALLAALTVVILPVLTAAGAIYVAGFAERSLEDNIFWIMLILFLPLDWALDKLFVYHPWWNRFESWWMSRRNRETYARSFLFAIIFSVIAIDVEQGLSQNLPAMLSEFALFFPIFIAFSFLFDWLGWQWRRYRAYRKNKPAKPHPN